VIDALFKDVAETRGITVRVGVTYLSDESEPARGRWSWSYHIRIENRSPMTVQLLTRHWIVTDGRGARHSVEGEGVIGEQPMIAPGGSFDYVSYNQLTTPTGSMQGSYRMIGEDGSVFDVEIPKFALMAPAVAE
jgi:ApaG protein